MSEINHFVNHFVEEALRKNSLAELLDSDINKECHKIMKESVDITPKAFTKKQQVFKYNDPQSLFVYPSKADIENYLLKSELLMQAMHSVKRQAVFEIRGNQKQIECCFYAEKTDTEKTEPAVKNFLPNSVTDIGKINPVTGDLIVYDFLPIAPFYKALTTFKGFVISPINHIPKLLLNIDENQTGAYQVILIPVSDDCHKLVRDAIDSEYKALQETDRVVLPSLQQTSGKVEYKSPEFKSYFAICTRIILPVNNLTSSVKAFISSYTYGSKAFKILDNQYYTQQQINKMMNGRVSFHTGYIVNSHELTSLLHIPFQILEDKTFNGIFQVAPVGDMPVKTFESHQDIAIGTWACGSNPKEIHLPVQKEFPHVYVLGVSRMGKSIMLSDLAMKRFRRNEACFVLDMHGDLITNILQMIPEDRIDDVIVIDFGLENATPEITIRENIDLNNPSKASDDLSESMRDVTSVSEQSWWGPKMSYAFNCLYYIFCVLPDLDLTHMRHLVSTSKKANVFRDKIKARISHPIIRDFLDEIGATRYESMAPVITRLSHLLLDQKSLRLFTLKKNRISISDIMENGKLCLVNLSCGIIGKQRASILAGLTDSLINNNILSRASIPYETRKPCTLIKDEFHMGPGDMDFQLTALAKYGLSVIAAHQFIDQLRDNTREVMPTAGTQIIFKVRRKDAEKIGRDFGIDPEEFTSLRKFQAIVKIEDEIVKINTPRPQFNEIDYSKEIMQNCLEKYYLKHDEVKPFKKQERLSFDTL